MNRMRTRMAAPVLLMAAMALAPALGGCALVGGAVNGAVQEATGGALSVGSLPDGWPEEVPVIDGAVVGGGKNTDGGTGWAAVISSNASDPVAEATAQLKAAGFAAPAGVAPDQIPGLEGVSDAAYLGQNGAYSVVVVGNADGVVYTVVPNAHQP